jgi:ABC-type amino acid transport substrate-binding protein
MQLDETVTVPPGGATLAAAHVVEFGTIGNISTLGFQNQCNDISNCGQAPVHDIFNDSPFTGGADPQTYTFVQQSDIDNAANDLISANSPNAQQVLQGQVQPNERFIGTPQCSPKTSENQSAGNHVSQVTVTVSFTCSGEAYDYDGALKLAQYLLKQHVQQAYPTIPYALVGTITTTMQNPSLTDASSGTVTMTIEASGTWVAQFDTNLKQALAQSIAGKTEPQAQAILKAQPGVKTASIQLQGGNSDILPTNPAQITFTIQET